MSTPLTDRWPLSDRHQVRDALLRAYAGSERGYHDTLHLAEVLDRLDELATETAFDRLAVTLAAWFHDGVHEGSDGDEERSAQWAERTLADRPALAAEVARLVRLTTDHRPARGDDNGAALCDADLAILAAAPGRYRAYVTGVRREYAHVNEVDFARGRTAVLNALVAGDLFHTPSAVRRWDAAARNNVRAELDDLATRADSTSHA